MRRIRSKGIAVIKRVVEQRAEGEANGGAGHDRPSQEFDEGYKNQVLQAGRYQAHRQERGALARDFWYLRYVVLVSAQCSGSLDREEPTPRAEKPFASAIAPH